MENKTQKIFTKCNKNVKRLAHQIARGLYKEQEAKKYNMDFLSYKDATQKELENLIKDFIKKDIKAWEELYSRYDKGWKMKDIKNKILELTREFKGE